VHPIPPLSNMKLRIQIAVPAEEVSGDREGSGSFLDLTSSSAG
jgi:hypothetical protein